MATKRTKTYSLDDTAIELVQAIAEQIPNQTQSGVLNRIILTHARALCRNKKRKLSKIRKLLQEAK